MFSGHKLYIYLLVTGILLTLILLVYFGLSYYLLPEEERFFHDGHVSLKPGGILGHGFGIIGSFCIIFGILIYVARKRLRFMSHWGLLKHWLEFHIFLCTLGPILILFHTSFKFGGIVAISFWSMVAVFLSGIIGRFIYIQIPRSIEGRELSLAEVQDMKTNIGTVLTGSYNLDEESMNILIDSTKKKVRIYQSNLFKRMFSGLSERKSAIRKVRTVLKKNKLSRQERKNVINLVKHELTLNRRIERLQTMQNLFKYWHVAHFPFAIVMLVIMVIHVAVTIVLGYRWIF
ncbi:MAG: hypothetical protein IH596_02310 [Bacteroidales bacterium]|nr:hypothetical protein [Bacteroidales bacterium]